MVAHAAIKALVPSYRDLLTHRYVFESGAPDLIEWVVTQEATDLAEFETRWAQMPPTGLSPDKHQALKRMLEVVIRSNRTLPTANPYDAPLPSKEIEAITQGLNEALSLSPILCNLETAAQVLLRIRAIDDLMAFLDGNWEFLRHSPSMRFLCGFLATIDGEHALALQLLPPLLTANAGIPLPLIDMCIMTAQYASGQWPQAPIRFDSIKQRHTASDAWRTALASMEITQPVRHRDRVILVTACDERYYYEHAVTLAHSIHHADPDGFSFHMHFYAPSEQQLADVAQLQKQLPRLDIGYSVEAMPESHRSNPTLYYSCARFSRLYELLEYYNAPVCLLDTDALVRRPWQDLRAAAGFGPQHEAAITYDARRPPWERVLGGFVYLTPTPTARAFITEVAAFIADNLAKGRWFLDQVALTAVYEKYFANNPSILSASAGLVFDTGHTDEAWMWVVTNRKENSPRFNAYRTQLLQKP